MVCPNRDIYITTCFGYLSMTMIEHLEQGNFKKKKRSLVRLRSQRDESLSPSVGTDRHGSRQARLLKDQLRAHILNDKQESIHWISFETFGTWKWLSSSRKTTPPQPTQAMPPIGDQIFKCWRTTRASYSNYQSKSTQRTLWKVWTLGT